MGKYFGTDGIRDKAERFTPEFLGKIVLGLRQYAQSVGLEHPKVLIGGDTRESSEWILADLAAALETLGLEYGTVEVLPTPAICYCFYQMGFDFAVDVTASHNPYGDNGIKIFERGELLGLEPGEVVENPGTEVSTSESSDIAGSKASEVSNTDIFTSTWTHCGRKLSPSGVNFIEKALDGDQIITPVATEIVESLQQDALDRYITLLTEYISRLAPLKAPVSPAYAKPESNGSPESEAPSRGSKDPEISPAETSSSPATSQQVLTATGNAGLLSGLKIALDCAHGATSVVAGEPFSQLGATVTPVNVDSSYGQSINAGVGSTHLESLISAVKQGDFDFGAAFDGDGDRCLLVDGSGQPVSGDQIIAIFAQYLDLKKLAVTVMANQGLINWAENHGVQLTITDVGDSNVAAAMRDERILLGGEESGHIILPGQPMGDGMLVALLAAKIIATTEKSLADLAAEVPLFPQLTTNVPATALAKEILRSATLEEAENDSESETGSGSGDENRADAGISSSNGGESEDSIRASSATQLAKILKSYTDELSTLNGRLLVRPSGTEPLVRVTLWGPDLPDLEVISARLTSELATVFNQIKEESND